MKTWVSLAIGATALTFQTMVLYPWHEEISYELHTLSRQVSSLSEKINSKN